MKFWQIVSIFRDDISSLRSVFEREQEITYLRWLTDFDALTRSQNRRILDAQLSESVIRKALQASKLRFDLREGFLRPISVQTSNQQLTALDVYLIYGGSVIEDALEYGSVAVSEKER